MSVVNKALEPFAENSHSIEKKNVVIDILFQETQEKITAKPTNRPYIIIVLLFISVFIFTYDRYYLKTDDISIETREPIAIETVLVNKPFEYADNSYHSKAPKSVLDFISAYSYIPNDLEQESESKVVIYEIIDEIDNSKKIDAFLSEATILFKGDKLTSPKGNNAFERYQMVLSLDSENKEALDGVQRIVDRYVDLSERVIKKNESYKVAGLIKNAYFVGERYIDMKPIVKKYAAYIDDQSVFINMSSETINLSSDTISAPIENTVDDKQVISIERSISDVDKDIALTASKLLADNNIDGAIVVLKRFTSLSDYWGKSYDLLFNLYIKQSNIKQAELLISNNNTLDIFQMAEKVARLFIAGEDLDSALNLLNSHNPDVNQYNEYYAVKAGLYHDSEKYNKAIDLYRKLISIDHDNARYWLGLAVSLDAVSDDGAVNAFRYAYEYSAPDSKVKQYIEQRLLVLAQ